MPATIYFRVGEKDEITLEEFLSAGQDFLRLLRELDATLSQQRTGSVRWTLSALSKNSPAIVGVTAKRRANRADFSGDVKRAVIQGPRLLASKGERPHEYSDAALGVLQRIADKTSKIGPSLIYTREDGVISTNQESALDTSTAQRIQQFTAPRSRAWGTLVGRLDTITVRKGTEFRIVDRETKSPVRCRFAKEQLDSIVRLLGKEVVASGVVHANTVGSPLKLDVDGEVKGREPRESSSIDELVGLIPNLTGGLSLLEYLGEDDATY